MFESSQAWLASTSSPMTCKFNIYIIYRCIRYNIMIIQYIPTFIYITNIIRIVFILGSLFVVITTILASIILFIYKACFYFVKKYIFNVESCSTQYSTIFIVLYCIYIHLFLFKISYLEFIYFGLTKYL